MSCIGLYVRDVEIRVDGVFISSFTTKKKIMNSLKVIFFAFYKLEVSILIRYVVFYFEAIVIFAWEFTY